MKNSSSGSEKDSISDDSDGDESDVDIMGDDMLCWNLILKHYLYILCSIQHYCVWWHKKLNYFNIGFFVKIEMDIKNILPLSHI